MNKVKKEYQMTKIIRKKKEISNIVANWRQAGKSVGLVPTMGALHEGHLSLVDIARQQCDKIVVSIFVNPAQFAPGEDFETYPRNDADDIQKLTARQTNIVYIPDMNEIYPEGFDAKIHIGGVSAPLCGTSRPHFFDGVTTIVSKLFLQIRPHLSFFGKKDYQQFLVIRKLVKDLDIPVEIIGCPILRETDGLAMSSRNSYLTASERQLAPQLFKSLQEIRQRILQGEACESVLQQYVKLLENTGFKKDYLEIRHAQTLQLPEDTQSCLSTPIILFAAFWMGKTRLIDNLPINCE